MALGIPRAEMLERMSSAELTEWMAFARLEPFGSEVYFIGTGIVAATVANFSGMLPKGRKRKEIKDFMPKFREEDQSVDSMIQIAETLTVGLGGKDLRGDK